MKLKVKKEHEFSHVYYQGRKWDFKLSTESQLNFEITKNLSFTNTIEAIYDTYPASGVKEFSYRLQNGIQFNF